MPDNFLTITQASADVTNSIADLVCVAKTINAAALVVGDLIDVEAFGEADPTSTVQAFSASATINGTKVLSAFSQSLGSNATLTKQGWNLKVKFQVRSGLIACQFMLVHSTVSGTIAIYRIGSISNVAVDISQPVSISVAVNHVAASAAKIRLGGASLRRVS